MNNCFPGLWSQNYSKPSINEAYANIIFILRLRQRNIALSLPSLPSVRPFFHSSVRLSGHPFGTTAELPVGGISGNLYSIFLRVNITVSKCYTSNFIEIGSVMHKLIRLKHSIRRQLNMYYLSNE